MTDDIIACGNGCKEADAAGVLQPRLTEGGRTLCEPCCDRLWRALDRLPDNYARLPEAIMPGSVERNPETKATKRVHAPAPLRIEPIDLSDERHYLLGGSLPVENVRGVVGALQRWANLIRLQQGGATNPTPTITSEVNRLVTAFDFLVRQPYAANVCKDVLAAHSDVKKAIGEYGMRVPGACPTPVIDDQSTEAHECGGPLFQIELGVRCVKCNSTWPPERLRALGMMIET